MDNMIRMIKFEINDYLWHAITNRDHTAAIHDNTEIKDCVFESDCCPDCEENWDECECNEICPDCEMQLDECDCDILFCEDCNELIDDCICDMLEDEEDVYDLDIAYDRELENYYENEYDEDD